MIGVINRYMNKFCSDHLTCPFHDGAFVESNCSVCLCPACRAHGGACPNYKEIRIKRNGLSYCCANCKEYTDCDKHCTIMYTPGRRRQ